MSSLARWLAGRARQEGGGGYPPSADETHGARARSSRTLVGDELCELDEVTEPPAAEEGSALALDERGVGPCALREGARRERVELGEERHAKRGRGRGGDGRRAGGLAG